MSYENRPGFTGNTGPNTASIQNVGSQIADHQGGLQYEQKPGGSLSGGAVPERPAPSYSNIPGPQEPDYEHISAPREYSAGGAPGGGSYGTGGGSNFGTTGGSNFGTTGGSNYSLGGGSDIGLGGGSQPGTGGAGYGSSGISTGADQNQSSGLPGQGFSGFESGPAHQSQTGGNAGSGFTGGNVGSGLTGGNVGSGLTGGNVGSGLTGDGSKASIGGGGVNKDTFSTGAGTPQTSQGVTGQPGVVQQAVDTVQPYVAQAQDAAAPYVAQAKDVAAPYVQKAQETAGPYVAQAQEVAAPYIAKAQELGSSAIENARPAVTQAGQIAAEKATQAYNAAAAELDARGINKDSTQQKLAEVGQTMKDYGAVGQQRAGEYLQQAVDQAKTIGQDGENKSIVATIFGTVFLVWLAFGFSIGAVFALGVAGSIAAVLSRYTSLDVNKPFWKFSPLWGHGAKSSTYTSSQQPSSSRIPGTGSNLATPGIETHYPRPAHPDNSLNSTH